MGTSAEAEMSRMERILYYCELAPEAALTTDPSSGLSSVLSHRWPSAGSIEFRDVVLAYKPSLPPVRMLPCLLGKVHTGLYQVLKRVSFSIKDKEKIGICGRTGAGITALS